MLYLIQSLVEKDDGDTLKILKIGYTDDLNSRMRSYYSHNPGTKLLRTREGDIGLESLFHSYFKKYKYEGEYFNEWFYWDKEIVSGFSSLGKEDMIDPEYFQKRYEDYLIKKFLTSPEDLLSKYWEDLKKDLEDKAKSTPSLSEFLDLEYLKSVFRDKLMEIYSSLEDYIRGIDYLKTFKENKLGLDFSESNINLLSSSILPQIAGRQRDRTNPFKNDITIFYRTIRGDKLLNEENFLDLQKQRRESTNAILSGYKKLEGLEKTEYIQTLKAGIKVYNYSRNFVSISKRTNTPVYNTLIEVANERAWEVSQRDYQDKISITKALESVSSEVSQYLDENEKIAQDFLDNHFYKTGIFKEKMRMYCEFMDTHKGNKEIENIIYFKIRDERFRKYYNFYGTKGCRAVSYEELKLYGGMFDATKGEELGRAIYNYFKIGQRYTKTAIKEGLGIIYQDLGITSKKPKTSDLEKYFTLVRTRISNKETGKLDEGYRLEPLS